MSTGEVSIKEQIRRAALEAGACAAGFASVGDGVDPAVHQAYIDWLAQGRHDTMDYLVRNADARRHPSSVLPGAASMLCAAFSYNPGSSARSPFFADYARGRDYHRVIPELLDPVAQLMRESVPGSDTRVCVDIFPVAERYWAVRAGIAAPLISGCVAVPGFGTKIFLAEILWTAGVTPDAPLTARPCTRCGRCVRSCPGKALLGDGTVDARRCLSCLTIEHRGEMPEGLTLPGRIYGCDVCQDVCPLNQNVPAGLPEFDIAPAVSALTADALAGMGSAVFRRTFARSAVLRISPKKLRANLARACKI